MKSHIVIAALLGIAFGMPESFQNHRIVDVKVKTKDEANYLINLEAVGKLGLDIWLYPSLKHDARLRVPPESIGLFMDLMTKAGIDAKIMHNNLKQLNDETLALPKSPVNYADFVQGNVPHNAYYRLADIDNYITGWVNGFSGVSRGYLSRESAEGRNTPYIAITGGSGSNKMNIFIEAGIHAREWISPASAMYVIDRLLNRRSVDADATDLYNNFNWFIVPVSNPDGYEYTHTTYRYWRKNRRSVSGCGSSRGVDLNRNFDSMWGGSGSSGSCSSDTYRGPSVFSEAESMNIRDFISDVIKPTYGDVDAYLSIHSYSQLLLTPYGYSANTYPPNNAKILELTNAAKDAISADSGLTYVVGSPADILYNADGSSADWARLADIRYAMTYELRPSGNQGLNGFVLPTSQIAPCSKEVWESIKAITDGLPA